jgi:Transglycosylase-like domain
LEHEEEPMRRTLVTALVALVLGGPASGAAQDDRPDRRERIVAPHREKLERMAGCESEHRWHIATGNGFFGGLQFTLGTWREAGGRGMPHRASKLEQMYRAVVIWRKRGHSWRDWPNCGFA